MMASPAPEAKAPAPPPSPGLGTPPAPVLGPKVQTLVRSEAPRDPLDQAAELFKSAFKGEIVP